MWQFEHTDTFAGEANYCWVRRETVDSASRRTIVRAAKRFAGFTGMRCVVDDAGDWFAIRPIGGDAPCQVVFATWVD